MGELMNFAPFRARRWTSAERTSFRGSNHPSVDCQALVFLTQWNCFATKRTAEVIIQKAYSIVISTI